MSPPPELPSNNCSFIRIKAVAKRAGLDTFLLLLLAMIGLAYLFPGLGAGAGPLPLEEITSYGVSLIFFFYGLRLSPAKLAAGLKDWRLHAVVQLSTFLLFPALVFLVSFLAGRGPENLMWLGVFFVAALPSTVSSSVVMVSIAGGNIPAAIFNASISSLLGVFLTPLWMGLYMNTSASADLDVADVMLSLVLQVLAPVILGILLNNRFGALAEANKSKLRLFDQSIILLIVYASFADSFAQDMFSGFTAWRLLLLGAAMLSLFLLVMAVIKIICRGLGFSYENQVTAIFCGSKKSLVHGTVMAKVLFPGADVVGILLLPLMFYHALQLLAASILAQRIARQTKENIII